MLASMLEQTSAHAPRMLFYICDHTPTASPKTAISNRGSPVNLRMGAGMEQGPVRFLYWRFHLPAYTANCELCSFAFPPVILPRGL